MRPALFLSFAATALDLALAASPADWRSQSVYFLLTDRFARTDSSTTAECNAQMGQYCGGTWQGIINQLDYIQGMGFTAIWITPITANIEDYTPYGEAYHGYWQRDIYSLNENYGSADDLRSLATALHDRGMYLMVDVVANHMGFNGSSDAVDYSIFNPFNSQEYFHTPCPIISYDDQTQVENCWVADQTVSLPDLDTTRSDVKEIWNNWIRDLVSDYSIDGIRIDTARHIQKDFWRDYNDAAGVYAVGEVLHGDPEFTCPYQEVLDGVLNYPIYYPLRRAFESTSGSISELFNMIEWVKNTCADSTLLGSFIENHDNPRFGSLTDDLALAQNVAAYVILSDGIPMIYAGQEQHYNGAKDPFNREATWLSGYKTDGDIYQTIKKANTIRTHAIGQDASWVTYKNWGIYHDNSNIAMRKGFDGNQIITILTNSGARAGSSTLDVPNTGYEAGSSVTEIYSCTDITVFDDGSVSVQMNGGLPRVLYPTEKLAGSGLCE
ncbi:glycoside hydrolase superfamily [Aspergillus karnatakaensis]|uniref:alpha-amylase n=1 Tax=Aspergillus karnatakaensis TaxID=1810916 RepID=UPI003CCE090F